MLTSFIELAYKVGKVGHSKLEGVSNIEQLLNRKLLGAFGLYPL